IIVFRYPLNISMDYVKRAIGIPGDHIRLVNRQLMLNGHLVNEPYVVHSQTYPDAYRDNFPSNAHSVPLRPRAAEMIEKYVVNDELWCRPGTFSRWETIATTPTTAATGASCRAKISSAHP